MSNEIEYLDFEISVQKAGENEYLIRAQSGDGEAEVRFNSPFNEDKRALIAATLTKVALRSAAKVRSSSAPEVRKMKDVGAILFEHAITGPVREFYYNVRVRRISKVRVSVGVCRSTLPLMICRGSLCTCRMSSWR